MGDGQDDADAPCRGCRQAAAGIGRTPSRKEAEQHRRPRGQTRTPCRRQRAASARRPVRGAAPGSTYRVRGKRRELELGSCRPVTLAEARETARRNRKAARADLGKRRIPTFADAVEAVIAIRSETWTSGGKSEGQWRASMRDYASPRCGNRPVDSIDTGDALAILSPIPARKPATAKRVRQRIDAAMKWAVANGPRPDNPAGEGRPWGSVERPRAGDPRRGANPRRWKRPGLSVLEARQGGGRGR